MIINTPIDDDLLLFIRINLYKKYKNEVFILKKNYMYLYLLITSYIYNHLI